MALTSVLSTSPRPPCKLSFSCIPEFCTSHFLSQERVQALLSFRGVEWRQRDDISRRRDETAGKGLIWCSLINCWLWCANREAKSVSTNQISHCLCGTVRSIAHIHKGVVREGLERKVGGKEYMLRGHQSRRRNSSFSISYQNACWYVWQDLRALTKVVPTENNSTFCSNFMNFTMNKFNTYTIT